MGALSLPEEAKLFCGLLVSPSRSFDTLYELLEDSFGSVELHSEIIPFDFTDYYTAEMGPGLKRQFISFEKTVPTDSLADIKTISNNLEKRWAKDTGRTINIDPGYLNLFQVVLASTKKFFHRIYLGDGIYAEITLYYRKRWTPLPWTFPDYQSPTAFSYFTELRNIYKQQQRFSLPGPVSEKGVV